MPTFTSLSSMIWGVSTRCHLLLSTIIGSLYHTNTIHALASGLKAISPFKTTQLPQNCTQCHHFTIAHLTMCLTACMGRVTPLPHNHPHFTPRDNASVLHHALSCLIACTQVWLQAKFNSYIQITECCDAAFITSGQIPVLKFGHGHFQSLIIMKAL